MLNGLEQNSTAGVKGIINVDNNDYDNKTFSERRQADKYSLLNRSHVAEIK